MRPRRSPDAIDVHRCRMADDVTNGGADDGAKTCHPNVTSSSHNSAILSFHSQHLAQTRPSLRLTAQNPTPSPAVVHFQRLGTPDASMSRLTRVAHSRRATHHSRRERCPAHVYSPHRLGRSSNHHRRRCWRLAFL